jgi:cytochrome c oxidase subunit 2
MVVPAARRGQVRSATTCGRPTMGRWLSVVAVAVGSPVVLSGCAGTRLGPPSPVTSQGEEISSLWSVFVSVAAVIGLLVFGLIVFAGIRYRRRRQEQLPPQFRYNVPLEVLYTGVPIVIVGVLFAITAGVITRVNAVSANPDLVVEVTGFQWGWRFHYPDSDITVIGEPGQDPVLVVPTDRTIRLELTSVDVIHSFYVPDFLEKRDLFPGSTEEIDLVVTEEGEYVGRCAEFCGTYHDRMLFLVRAVSPASFQTWVDERAARG